MSGFDDLMHDLQTAIGQPLYAVYGDRILNRGQHARIKSAHPGNRDDLSAQQNLENDDVILAEDLVDLLTRRLVRYNKPRFSL